LASANADEAFTAALARWTSTLWQVKARSQGATLPHVYVDGLSLAVYTDTLIPRGLIGTSGKILGCRALTLLHDDQGHPLLASTHRGDLHLTNGIPAVLTCYEQATVSSVRYLGAFLPYNLPTIGLRGSSRRFLIKVSAS
jgi:hypothetical protein